MAHDGHQHQHGHHGHGHHGVEFDSAEAAAFAESEAEVLAGFVTGGADALVEQAVRTGLDVGRILDVGCGPGVAACELAHRFEAASVVAADASPVMLERAAARAARLGLAERVVTREVTMPDGLAGLEPADVVWASMALHHVGDQAGAVRGLRALLRRGGLLAIVEFGGPVRVVVQGTPLADPTLWDRIDAAFAAWFADLRAELAPGEPRGAATDHAALVAAAGCDVVEDRRLTVDAGPSLDGTAARFAFAMVERARTQLGGYVGPEDRAVLDAVVDRHAADGALPAERTRLSAWRRLVVGRAT